MNLHRDSGARMDGRWNTKWGWRQVKQNPPTMLEAFAAAECLTDDRAHQIELAAGLLGVPVEEARAAAARIAPTRPQKTLTLARRGDRIQTVVVERKSRRRIAAR